MINQLVWLISCLILLSSSIGIFAQETGTLVVTYQTGPKGERLDRVRFNLIDENNDEQMYPKGDSFAEDEEGIKRTVAIENLKVGTYKLHFLIPNTDALFDQVPDKTIQILAHHTQRVDQIILPHYASLKAMAKTLPNDRKFSVLPTLMLKDQSGNITAVSTSGKMIVHSLLPDCYTLSFESIEGFETPPPIKFSAEPGKHIGVLVGTYQGQTNTSKNEIAASVIVQNPQKPNSTLVITQINGQLTLTTNMPQAHWTIIKNNVPVYTGKGSVINHPLLEGDNYRIVPEELEGYSVRINPPYPFNLYQAQTIRAEIVYDRTYGSISIEAPFPEGESVVIILSQKNGSQKSYPIRSRNNKIYWLSPQMPTGTYELTYRLPKGYDAPPSETIYIKQGERNKLFPHLYYAGILKVVSNIPDSTFSLKLLNEQKGWKGGGSESVIKGLPSGVYILSSASPNPDFNIPPPDIRFAFNGKETKVIKTDFQIGGKLTINTNVERAKVVIQELADLKRTYKDEITGKQKAFTLLPGKYKVSLIPAVKTKKANQTPPQPVEVTISALASQEIQMPFSEITTKETKSTETAPKTALTISTNIPNARFTITRQSGENSETLSTHTGKETRLQLSPGVYQLNFFDIPSYKTPDPITIDTAILKEESIVVTYLSNQELLFIPAGKSIVGDASTIQALAQKNAAIVTLDGFSISPYVVTNAQFAEWLNDATTKKTVFYIKEADREGKIINSEGKLIAKTFEADSFSQITARHFSQHSIEFVPMPGKEQYPVINVTWYGAVAYCKDHNCRLPTEAEWEKAAGMETESKNVGLKKYTYGFGQNEIDPTWANYKSSDRPIQYFQVLTTPIGFYNGINLLPLTANDRQQLKTHLAKSPYGAYDMSGNVWEWTADWYSDQFLQNLKPINPSGPESGTFKVVKGGCYDSLAQGVRVTERLGLSLDYCDAYTGFRIAKIKNTNEGQPE